MPAPIPPFPLDGRAIVLASSSPRRHELLSLLGVDFTVDPPDEDETPLAGESPLHLVARLAAVKAEAVAARHVIDAIIIAADTAVDVDGEILGKPTDPADAERMLSLLSGRTHLVHTAVAVASGGRIRGDATTSAVTFVPIGAAEIDWYLATGEPFDKAGGYALQGAGGAFVASVDGSVTGVLGLPLDVTVGLLRALPPVR